MSFVWVTSVAVAASIDAADRNEEKTNLDTIYAFLSITRGGCGAGAGWTELPVVKDIDAIKNVQYQQLRDVTDYAYDNKCSGYDAAANDAAHKNDDNSGYQDADLAGVDATHYQSDLATPHNSGYQSADEAGVDATYYLSNLAGPHNSTYNSSEDIGYDNYHCTSFLEMDDKPHDTSVCGAYYLSNKSAPHYISNCASHWTSVMEEN